MLMAMPQLTWKTHLWVIFHFCMKYLPPNSRFPFFPKCQLSNPSSPSPLSPSLPLPPLSPPPSPSPCISACPSGLHLYWCQAPSPQGTPVWCGCVLWGQWPWHRSLQSKSYRDLPEGFRGWKVRGRKREEKVRKGWTGRKASCVWIVWHTKLVSSYFTLTDGHPHVTFVCLFVFYLFFCFVFVCLRLSAAAREAASQLYALTQLINQVKMSLSVEPMSLKIGLKNSRVPA